MNQMAAAKLVAMGSKANAVQIFNVEGTTYNPLDGKIQDWLVGRIDANLQMIAKIAAVCNDAGIEQAVNHYVATGMPTEAALKLWLRKWDFLMDWILVHLEVMVMFYVVAGLGVILKNGLPTVIGNRWEL